MPSQESVHFLRQELRAHFGAQITLTQQTATSSTAIIIGVPGKPPIPVRIHDSVNQLMAFHQELTTLETTSCQVTRVGWFSRISLAESAFLLLVLKADGPSTPIRGLVIPTIVARELANHYHQQLQQLRGLYIDVNANGDAWAARFSNWRLTAAERCAIARNSRLLAAHHHPMLKLTDYLENWQQLAQ